MIIMIKQCKNLRHISAVSSPYKDIIKEELNSDCIIHCLQW